MTQECYSFEFTRCLKKKKSLVLCVKSVCSAQSLYVIVIHQLLGLLFSYKPTLNEHVFLFRPIVDTIQLKINVC